MSYRIRYRTFDQLMAEVKTDFPTMDADGYIDPQDYIKHAKYVNSHLGLKIHTTKQRTIEIRNGRGKLPNDFDVFNYACIIQTHTEVIPMTGIATTHIVPLKNYDDNKPVTNVCITLPETPEKPKCDPCNHETHCSDCTHEYKYCACIGPKNVRIDCNGNATVLLAEYRSHTRVYKNLIPLRLVNSPAYEDEYCFEKRFDCENEITIRDGFVSTSIQTGTLYLNYEGMLEDDEGNLLVLDHDMINMYYEYYLKSKALENAEARGYLVPDRTAQRIERNLKEERIKSLSIVNQVEFTDIQKTYASLRKAFYMKYFSAFSSY